jgi:MFS family permease
MLGALSASLFYVATTFSPNMYWAVLIYGVFGGISSGCLYLASLIIIPDYFDKKKGIATGITMAGSGLGSIILTPLIEKLLYYFDWKITMVFCSVFLLHVCVLGAFMKPFKSQQTSNNNYKKK